MEDERQWYKLVYLLIYVSRYLDQETAKKHFRPLNQVVTFYLSNHSKVEASLSPMLCRRATSEISDILITTVHYRMLNVQQESCKYQLRSGSKQSIRRVALQDKKIIMQTLLF